MQAEIDRLKQVENDGYLKSKTIKELQTKNETASQAIQSLSHQIAELKKDNEVLKLQVFERQQDINHLHVVQENQLSLSSQKRDLSQRYENGDFDEFSEQYDC